MKTIILLSSVLIMSILISCKKSSSNSISQESSIIGKWTIINDSTVIIYYKSSGNPTYYNNAVNTSNVLFEQYLSNNQFVFNAYNGATYETDSSETWHFVDNNHLVVGDPYYFNGVLQESADTSLITNLDAHNLNMTSIKHGYIGYDSVTIDYENLKR
ncbi:MAG TPA: hypothetical protein VK718_09250 [Ferruginibacter sp.]|jgi:hypothetical protein|nr:hypothetical protein [Ferruginibacter sp.]